MKKTIGIVEAETDRSKDASKETVTPNISGEKVQEAKEVCTNVQSSEEASDKPWWKWIFG